MTDKLYGHPHLCIRELLQNALDALRYRNALFASEGLTWDDGHVELRHFVDESGFEVVQCSDNGSGMDEDIIKNHFVKIGRSFYRSPEFERERARLRATGNDFAPCSRFGIGFMSCFMLGDQITIETRRDYGAYRGRGHPLIIEIHGLGGLLIIRDGTEKQPVGTTVSIRSRKKPSLIDKWSDEVRLVDVLKGYALATEFPITGTCDLPELSERVTIPPQAEKFATYLEETKVRRIVTLEQDLSAVDGHLNGMVRASFLIDENGLPGVGNDEAQWRGVDLGRGAQWALRLFSEDRTDDLGFSRGYVPVCVDGILIAGSPGRASYRQEIEGRLGSRSSNLYFGSGTGEGLVDVRGDLKPELTPGRTPPDDAFGVVGGLPGWERLAENFDQGVGLLWGELADYLGQGLGAEQFWQLVSVHGASVSSIPHRKLWDLVPVSLIDARRRRSWHRIRDLGELSMEHSENSTFGLRDVKGRKVGLNRQLDRWEKGGVKAQRILQEMNWAVLLTSRLDVCGGKIVLVPTPPSDSRTYLSQYMVQGFMSRVVMFLIDYMGEASSALAVEMPFPTGNRNHPLAVVAHGARHARKPTEIQQFARNFVYFIAKTVSLEEKSPTLEKPGYWHKQVAHSYFAVQWDAYDRSLKPPYKVWTSQNGWHNITEDDLACWRDCAAKRG